MGIATAMLFLCFRKLVSVLICLCDIIKPCHTVKLYQLYSCPNSDLGKAELDFAQNLKNREVRTS